MTDYALMHVLKARGRVLVQDFGREGWQHLGISQSGAADGHAFNAANQLVFNPEGSPALEICLGNCEFLFNSPTVIAVTGAKTEVTINGAAPNNGKIQRTWSRFAVAAGDVVKIGLPKSGLLNYLAVAGSFKVRTVCDSASQCEREQLGPNGGLPYQVGDTLAYLAMPNNSNSNVWSNNQESISHQQKLLSMSPVGWWQASHIPEYAASETVLKTYLYQGFNTAHQTLLANTYTVTERANRMAYRLSGPQINLPPEAYLCQSAGVPYGAIQLPPDGQPIILLKDRQTMGGYPVIGCIDEQSAWRLSQLRSGRGVRFFLSKFVVGQ